MNILRNLSVSAAILMLWSCMPDQYASVSEYDDIYFSSADMREVNYASLVQNNEPQNFSSYHNNAENIQMENFSAKNVNPDYIARYANQNSTTSDSFGSDDYFVESYGNNGTSNQGNLANQGQNTTYNNYRVTNNNGFGGMGMMSPFGMGMGMGGFGMSPFGMGMGMSPWGMGGFGMSPFGYDPFFDPFFPRSGFGMSVGFGFSNFGFGMGSMRMRNMMAMTYGSPFYGGGFGNPFFMDPWMSPFGFNHFGYGGFGAFGSPFGFGNRFYSPVVIINNSDVPRQQYVRGPRDGRSSQFANANTNMTPATRSAVAAQRSNAGANQVTSQRRDFTQTQNEYYQNSRRSVASSNTNATRNTASAITSNTRRGYTPSTVNNSRRGSTTNYGRPATTTTNSRSNSVMNNSSTRSRMGTSTPPSRTGTMSTGGASRGSMGGGTMSTGGGASRSSGGGGVSSSGGRGGR
jgi:hypothetical protein